MAEKVYEFKLTIRESDVEGDEFWDDCLDEDPSGIFPLTKTLKNILVNSNLFSEPERIDEMLQLLSFKQT